MLVSCEGRILGIHARSRYSLSSSSAKEAAQPLVEGRVGAAILVAGASNRHGLDGRRGMVELVKPGSKKVLHTELWIVLASFLCSSEQVYYNPISGFTRHIQHTWVEIIHSQPPKEQQ